MYVRMFFFYKFFFEKKIKKGASFSETSPMLHDISGMADWGKVCLGLMRMFEGTY